MSELAKVFERDRFATGIGVELLEVGEGRAVARLAVGPEHLNAAGVVQGGAVFTLADFAFAVASNSRGNVALAIEAHVTFVRAVRAGVLRAEAREEGGRAASPPAPCASPTRRERWSPSSRARPSGRTIRCRSLDA